MGGPDSICGAEESRAGREEETIREIVLFWYFPTHLFLHTYSSLSCLTITD